MFVHTATERPRRVLIRADRLFDGVSDGVSNGSGCSVLVDAGRIVAVGSALRVPDAEVVDLGGATLVPGLVDPHVHLAFDASADPVGALA
ncbi:MAG: amidohydrolase family protein, partial [Gaiellaceae bacterium]